MSIKFIHAADLHIDSPLKGLAEKDQKVAEKIREATRDSFRRLVDFAIEQKVSFIVIAGDIFDGDWDDVETGLWTSGQFQRLDEYGVPVYVAYGNHDGKNDVLKNMAKKVFSANAHVFGSEKPERFFFEDKTTGERVAITGQSYSDWKCPENLAANYPDPEPGVYNIAVLHTGLGGESAGVYAPTTVPQLRGLGYDYWALGHQHSREVLYDAPDCFIAYTGVIQARHINEASNKDGDPAKGFFLVETERGRRVGEPVLVPVDSFRWVRVDVDLSEIEATDPEDAEPALIETLFGKLKDAIAKSDGRNLAARVRLYGRSCLYGRLTGLYDGDSENPTRKRIAQRLGALGGKAWIERFDVDDVRPPVPDNFWDRGVFKEIRDAVEAQNAELEDKKGQGGGYKFAKTFPSLGGLVSKKLSTIKTELLYGGSPDSDDAPEPDPDGIALDDPEQYRKWNLESLDVLADAFASADENTSKRSS